MRPSHRAEAIPLDAALLQRWPLPSGEGDDKLGRGTVVVVGATAATPGAVVLAGIAALRMGAGRLQIATPTAVVTAVAVAVPEAAVLGNGPSSAEELTVLDRRTCDAVESADAVVVGSGTYAGAAASEVLDQVLRCASLDAVVVVDAGALSCLDDVDTSVLERRAGRLVVTPNRQEIASLVGPDVPAEPAIAAVELGAVVTSFGEVCSPDGSRWRVVGPAPGLGTSGSGDVLAGLVGGAAARGAEPAQAACWGTFVHHDAAGALAERVGPIGYLARELADTAPRTLARIAALR